MIAVLFAAALLTAPISVFTMIAPVPADGGQGPGYTTPDPNGQATQVIRLPSVCSTSPLACNYIWSPDDGTFHHP